MASFGKLVLALSFVALISCTKSNDKYENFVKFAVIGEIKGVDPVNASDLYSGLVVGHLYDTLFEYDYLKRPYTAVPNLTEAPPKISKDGLVYTFRLKSGVLFQDDPCFKATNGKGREMVAEDVIYSWKRLADTSTQTDGFWIFDGRIKGFTAWRDEMVKAGKVDYTKPVPGLKALDAHTLEVTLEKPFPQFVFVLTMPYSSVVPHEAVEFYGPDFKSKSVGTGPYRLVKLNRNSEVIMEKNPTYRKEVYPSEGMPGDKEKGLLDDAGKTLPLNDGVIIKIFVEDQPRWLNFMKGELDYVNIPKDNYDSAMNGKELKPEFAKKSISLQIAAQLDSVYQTWNLEDPVWGQKNPKGKLLRKAACYAIDSQEFIEKFYNGRAISSQGPVPPEVVGYDPNLKNPCKDFSIEKAKELLVQAGYPGGKGLSLNFETTGGTTGRQIAEYIQQSLGKIGIEVKISMNTWPEFITKQRQKKAQFFGLAWGADYPDAENFFQLFYGPNESPGSNNSNYKNAEFDALYKKAAVLNDGPERSALYKKMSEHLVEEAPWIYQVHRIYFYMSHGWLKNFKKNELSHSYGKFYRIDQDEKARLKKGL